MIELLTLPFFQRALLVGLILSIVMALLGVLVVLRKMAFFSDAIGHSALTGIAAGLLLGINPFVGAFIAALLIAASIVGIRRVTTLSLDTLLGVFFAAFVSAGVLLISFSPGYQADLITYLFGNILTVTRADLIQSAILAIGILAALLRFGKKFVAIALDPALAKAEGIAIHRYDLLFLLLLAEAIALSIKVVGVILVTALLVIPAASAQNAASSLTHMFMISVGASMFSVVVGMIASAFLRAPSGPVIIFTSTAVFAASLLVKRWR